MPPMDILEIVLFELLSWTFYVWISNNLYYKVKIKEGVLGRTYGVHHFKMILFIW
jgi:hypothetical protein